ncbi:MAG: hypothetical protein Q8N88_03720 [Nanoarchaeota archaeon]|nr:hypothetical protein [Nanoarchaeota archaeon]
MKKKTVFFGPFVGEFGWELFCWHGWVKRLCKTRYKDYRKIACSFPGRYPFYPEVDEFWPLPEEFLKISISPRNYMTDYWIDNYPKSNVEVGFPNVWPILSKIIEGFKKKLPADTEFIHPWVFRYDKEDKRYYGVEIKEPLHSIKNNFITYSIPPAKQILERLEPTPKGLKMLEKIVSPADKFIVIFPRRKLFRRPDKNWPKENYEVLIKLIQEELPEYKIAIAGEPGGAFFAEGVPENCIDLINVDPNRRMDIQLAALKQAELSLGGESGGICFALASGSKVLSWGNPGSRRAFSKENYMRTPLVFLPYSNPSADLVFKYIKWLLNSDVMPLDNVFRILKIIFYKIFNPRYPHLIKLRLMQILK